MKRPQISELTLEEKIGQLLMIAQYPLFVKVVDGVETPRAEEEIKEIMQKCQFGSIWGQGKLKMKNVNLAEEDADGKANAAEYKEFIKDIEKNVRIPMLVGMDCENGATLVDGGTSISGPLSIGAADDEKLTFDLAQSVAKEMRAAGGNWRWSPVVDIANRFCGVSSGRTFSDNAEMIVKHAVAAVKGTESAGVASTIKHFPGMDPYEMRDGHFTETMINISYEEWKNTQARTFQGVFDAGVDTVMVGHIAFPGVDDTMVNGRYLPATISEKIIKKLLREEMGFDGVVITDGIGMASLQTICPFEEVLVRAINAGNDILLGVGPSAAETVKQAVLDGRIPMERIDESAERVLKLKEKLGLFDDKEEEFDIYAQSEITRKIDREIAEKSVTLVRERCKLTADGAFKTDSNINNGYPSLSWETAVVENPYVISAVSSGNNMKVTIAENEAVTGAKVYVASYATSGRLLNAQTLDAKAGTQTTNVSNTSAAEVKVFVWDNELSPIADSYTGVPLENGQMAEKLRALPGGDDEVEVTRKTRLVVIGDSIMDSVLNTSGSQWNKTGWEKHIGSYLNDDITVIRHGHSGYTIQHFMEGSNSYHFCSWETIKDQFGEGDYVIVSLGANDNSRLAGTHQTESFTEDYFVESYKKIFADVAAKGAKVMIATPIPVNGSYNSATGRFVSDSMFPLGRQALARVVAETGVECIDLSILYTNTLNKLIDDGVYTGDEMCITKSNGTITAPGVIYVDDTHTSDFGSQLLAETIAKAIKETSKTGLEDFIVLPE